MNSIWTNLLTGLGGAVLTAVFHYLTGLLPTIGGNSKS